MGVDNLCRVCDKPSTKLLGIFEKNADGKQILHLIRECLPVIIYRKDPLSKLICVECLENIEHIHAFRKSSLEIVDQQTKRLNQKTKDALIYLDIYNNSDQSEMWMYSSPIKKYMGKAFELCVKCKIEIPNKPKPFRKYKEAVRKVETSSDVINGYINESTNVDTEVSSVHKISLKRLHRACHTYDCFPKRPRIIGPKSKSQPFIKSVYTEMSVYNPLSLLMCSLNVINKQIVSDYKSGTCEESIKVLERNEYICEYCLEEFGTRKDLASHEIGHIKVKLNRVDNIEVWSSSIDEAICRNKWLRESYDEEGEWEDFNEDDVLYDESENLLMPLEQIATEVKGEIELTDGKPTVNGVLLSELPKTERRAYYNQNYNLNGVKRKFCPLCRYTFKDNWAIELHYFSSACYYTCRYCGIRFNKQRAQFDDHVNQHVQNGDIKTDKVFSARKKNDPIPKVLCDANTARAHLCTSPKLHPKVKPLKMRQLFERTSAPPKTTLNAYNDSQNIDKQNQAYFCRKCYKVFFKLDEFNNHVNNCTELPENYQEDNVTYVEEEKYEPPRKYQRTLSSPANSRSDESFSSTGRPIRNCVKDVTYRDHLDIEVEPEEEEEIITGDMNFKGIECGLCNAVFPTIPSRNSHMRIHKNGFKFSAKGQLMYTQKSGQNSTSYQNNLADESSYSRFDDIPIKQEPLEPLVEIHESNSVHDIPSSIGSVSITPIPNKMQKTSINPDIMKLVESNPNITIRSMHPPPAESPIVDNTMDDGIRSYRCSSCAKTFTNKSNLYFHKKNQCEGSRYPCPFCKKRFGTEAAYSSHIFYSHPE